MTSTEPTTDPKATTLTGMVRQAIVQKPAEMEAKGVPMPRAEEKYQSTLIGFAGAVLGLGLLGVSGYGMVLLLNGAREIGVMSVALIAAPGLFGLVIFGVSMTMVSRDASPALDKMGELVVKIVRAVRGGGGGA